MRYDHCSSSGHHLLGTPFSTSKPLRKCRWQLILFPNCASRTKVSVLKLLEDLHPGTATEEGRMERIYLRKVAPAKNNAALGALSKSCTTEGAVFLFSKKQHCVLRSF